MDVSESYWRRLSYELAGSLPYTASPRDCLNAIARLFIQGRIQLFEINESRSEQYPIEKRSFKQSDGKIYQFATPTEQLINPHKKTKKFHSIKEATEFLIKLNPEKENLREISRDFRLLPQTNRKSDEQEALLAPIADAIVKEEILIFIEIPSNPPTPETIYEDVYITPTPLAPETYEEETVKTDKKEFFFST